MLFGLALSSESHMRERDKYKHIRLKARIRSRATANICWSGIKLISPELAISRDLESPTARGIYTIFNVESMFNYAIVEEIDRYTTMEMISFGTSFRVKSEGKV